ncbi:hypothetical protein TFLX_03890 [Thermoflexales bacterium]|nr:hypothetical protein TFLX_03890 [Thermoflexales bacterium]
MKIKNFIPQPSAFILWAIVALLWANLPYLIGYASSTSQNQFGGFFLYEQDGYSYYAKMRQGAQGAWDFQLPYTSEDEYQDGNFVYPFYLTLGKLAPLGFSYPLLYHGARLLSSLLLLIVLAKFMARFVADQRWQRWTWWLLLFGGGWGLLVSLFFNQKHVAYELIAPDAFVFSVLYGTPHVILGFALFLIWIGYVLDLTSRRFQPLRKVAGQVIIANVLGLLTALSREAYGPAFAGIFLAYLVTLIVQRRKIPWREGFLAAVSCISAGLYGAYLVVAFRTSPALAAWSQQNPFTSPDLFDFLIGFAPLIVLAAGGLYLYLARRHALSLSRQSFFLSAWLIAGPLLTYLPIAISRRLIAGWQIPLCIFGAYALLRLIDSRLPLRRTLAFGALTLSAVSTLIVIGMGLVFVGTPQSPLYQTADQLAALQWLGRHTTVRDVVLSDWRFGNQLPIYAEARVFIGHPIETIDYPEKQAAVDRFFDPSTAETDRQAVIDRWQITLVVASNDRFRPTAREIVFQQGAWVIYRTAP